MTQVTQKLVRMTMKARSNECRKRKKEIDGKMIHFEMSKNLPYRGFIACSKTKQKQKEKVL